MQRSLANATLTRDQSQHQKQDIPTPHAACKGAPALLSDSCPKRKPQILSREGMRLIQGEGFSKESMVSALHKCQGCARQTDRLWDCPRWEETGECDN